MVMYSWETYWDTSASNFHAESGYIYATDIAAQAAAPTNMPLALVRTSGGVVIWSSVAITAGAAKRPQGWGEGYGPGSGQVADMGFRYRLTGYLWTWDDKSAADPRLWRGHGAEFDISATPYTYGSAIDALEAGKAVGNADVSVMRVFSESNYPTQFAGRQYTYTTRLQTAWNAGAKEANDAYIEYSKDLGDVPGGPGVAIPWGGLFVVGLVLVFGVIIINYFTRGKVEVT